MSIFITRNICIFKFDRPLNSEHFDNIYMRKKLKPKSLNRNNYHLSWIDKINKIQLQIYGLLMHYQSKL